MTIFEMARKYYPRLWRKERIDVLREAGKLTDDEYVLIIGVEDLHDEKHQEPNTTA